MKALVTGGLGVVGSKYATMVAEMGHDVVILDAAEEPRNHWTAQQLMSRHPDRIRIIIDRVERFNFTGLLKECDFILHAAAHTGIPHSEKDPSDDWVSNVDATRNILEYMRKVGADVPTVMLSSVKPYKLDDITTFPKNDRTSWDIDGIDETCVLEPDEPYAASKMAQSALGMAYARTYDLPVTVLRCSNLYGDAPCHGPRHGWLTWFCISAALDWTIELQGTGRQTRDMLFSDDVTRAVLSCFQNARAVRGNVYNIGGGFHNSVSCRESIPMIESVVGRPVKTEPGPGRRNEDMIFITNHAKFTKATTWDPEVGVEEGIVRITNWALEHADDLKRLYETQPC